MKMLSPAASLRSVGRIQWWTPLIAIACFSCLPFFNVVAAEHHGGGGHPSASHGGGGSKSAGVHHSGSHVASSHGTVSHVASSHHVASTSHQVASTSHHVASASHHVASTSHHVATSSHRVASTSHREASTSNHVVTTNRTRNNPGLRNTSPELRKGASANTRTSLYSRNGAGRNARTPGRETAYNRSLSRSSVHGLMDRRLTQIGSRQWGAHGAVFSTRSDPRGGYWFHHGGYWWRGNFWGARSYCYNLIGLGFAPGLCWAWYDDICWGNIVIGMPYALIPYYYQDPVYTGDTSYDGEQATVYDYALPDGQYKQVTVVDGNVVDVEIVDQIS